MTRAADGTRGREAVSRRGVVKTLAAGALAGSLGMRPQDAAMGAAQEPAGTPVATAQAQSTPLPVGQPAPELAAVGAVMGDLMARWQLPGGQLALANDGRLVLDLGYGLADVERGEPVQPTSLIRIASVTKAITAVAILTLVDAGQLSLDDAVFPLLDFAPPAHATPDPRLAIVTVRDLLVHAGGWDSAQSFDPQGLPFSRMAAASVGLADPAEAATIVRFMLGEPLDFDPGARQAYSNFGFNVLGRVIEQVSGQPYDAYVRDHVLAPAGITRMRLGRTRLADRAPGEVRYYAPPGQPMSWSVFWGEGYAPFAYGGNTYLEALDAHGGWIASAADLVRFATAVDGQRGPALLTPETVETMLTTPRPPTGVPSTGIPGVTGEVTDGLGWDVIPAGDDVTWSRVGALMGSSAAWVARRPDGATIAFTVNSLPADYNAFLNEAIAALSGAVDAVQTWPEGDLFLADDPAPASTGA
jgi:N-acyl-D-amino-acid deacylase